MWACWLRLQTAQIRQRFCRLGGIVSAEGEREREFEEMGGHRDRECVEEEIQKKTWRERKPHRLTSPPSLQSLWRERWCQSAKQRPEQYASLLFAESLYVCRCLSLFLLHFSVSSPLAQVLTTRVPLAMQFRSLVLFHPSNVQRHRKCTSKRARRKRQTET